MRILLVSQFFPPETSAGARRVGAMARALSRRASVTVLTLKPSYPTPDHFIGLDISALDHRHAGKVLRAFTFRPHAGGILRRGVREAVMAYRLLAAARGRNSVDLVVASSPSMFLGSAGLMFARMWSVPFAWDIRDLIWRYPLDSLAPSAWTKVATALLEERMQAVMHGADLVVTATPGITTEILGMGLPSHKLVTLPNGVTDEVLQDYANLPDPNHAPPVTVTYAGVLGYTQGLATFIDAARLTPEVRFVLAGDGPQKGDLEERARSFGLTNVVFLGYCDGVRLRSAYRDSHMMFAQLRGGRTLMATGLPSKLFEYMATGRPIVYAGGGIAAQLLSETSSAAIVPPENPEALSAEIRRLAQAPADRQRLGRNGRRLVERHFRRDVLMDAFADMLERRMSARSRP